MLADAFQRLCIHVLFSQHVDRVVVLYLQPSAYGRCRSHLARPCLPLPKSMVPITPRPLEIRYYGALR